jgi:hypothetical protein
MAKKLRLPVMALFDLRRGRKTVTVSGGQAG